VPTPPLSDELAREAVESVRQNGSVALAAEALGIPRGTIAHRLRIAASRGLAPGHFTSGVAPGYRMGKVTVQRNAGGDVERTWERQSPDDEAREAMFRAAADALAADLPRVAPIAAPELTLANLLVLYVLTDFHLNMLAWNREGGADWDLKIAETTGMGALEALAAGAPEAETAILDIGGDWHHSDSYTPVTPAHGHVLDADSRFGKSAEVSIRMIRRMVAILLAKHARVVVIFAEGNHDPMTMLWMRKLFAALYENEPRVTVNDSELPYYVYQHGATMLCFHHGHLKKNDQLPLLFAAQFPTIWGATTKRYAHTGHRHHVEEKEHSGMTVVQHPTLAARDAYAARGGWIADRAATATTYHRVYGKVATNSVVPEMLETASAA
jgi:hypothetical protein